MTTSTCRLMPLVLAGWLTAAAAPAEEHVSFHPPPGFRRPTATQARDYLQLQFVKDGEEASAWTELLRVEQFRRTKADRSPREAYDHLKATADERCPGVTDWRILQEDEGTFLFESITKAPCEGQPVRWEIARLFLGRNTRYQVAYLTRAEPTPEVRDTWISWLRGTSLDK